jgi:cell division protein YceG involved in septum cleavage
MQAIRGGPKILGGGSVGGVLTPRVRHFKTKTPSISVPKEQRTTITSPTVKQTKVRNVSTPKVVDDSVIQAQKEFQKAKKQFDKGLRNQQDIMSQINLAESLRDGGEPPVDLIAEGETMAKEFQSLLANLSKEKWDKHDSAWQINMAMYRRDGGEPPGYLPPEDTTYLPDRLAGAD